MRFQGGKQVLNQIEIFVAASAKRKYTGIVEVMRRLLSGGLLFEPGPEKYV